MQQETQQPETPKPEATPALIISGLSFERAALERSLRTLQQLFGDTHLEEAKAYLQQMIAKQPEGGYDNAHAALGDVSKLSDAELKSARQPAETQIARYVTLAIRDQLNTMVVIPKQPSSAPISEDSGYAIRDEDSIFTHATQVLSQAVDEVVNRYPASMIARMKGRDQRFSANGSATAVVQPRSLHEILRDEAKTLLTYMHEVTRSGQQDVTVAMLRNLLGARSNGVPEAPLAETGTMTNMLIPMAKMVAVHALSKAAESQELSEKDTAVAVAFARLAQADEQIFYPDKLRQAVALMDAERAQIANGRAGQPSPQLDAATTQHAVVEPAAARGL